MSSIFYHQRKSPKYVMSFLFLEVLDKAMEKHADYDVAAVLILTLKNLGYDEPYKEEDVADLAERVSKLYEKSEKSGEKKSLQSKGRSFGTDYLKWIAKQGPDKLCLIAANYDVRQATHLYCDVDKSVADEVISLKLVHDWNKLYLSFEACVYGFGGNLKGGGSGEEEETDMKDGINAETAQELASLGF